MTLLHLQRRYRSAPWATCVKMRTGAAQKNCAATRLVLYVAVCHCRVTHTCRHTPVTFTARIIDRCAQRKTQYCKKNYLFNFESCLFPPLFYYWLKPICHAATSYSLLHVHISLKTGKSAAFLWVTLACCVVKARSWDTKCIKVGTSSGGSAACAKNNMWPNLTSCSFPSRFKLWRSQNLWQDDWQHRSTIFSSKPLESPFYLIVMLALNFTSHPHHVHIEVVATICGNWTFCVLKQLFFAYRSSIFLVFLLSNFNFLTFFTSFPFQSKWLVSTGRVILAESSNSEYQTLT